MPGVAISATGNLSLIAGSFVELADQGKITMHTSTGLVTDSFTIIVGFTINTDLTNNTFTYSRNFSGTTFTPSTFTPSFDTASGNFSILSTTSFSKSDDSQGGYVLGDSNLTLVSDPVVDPAPQTSAAPEIPGFRVVRGGPAPAAVPKPSTLVQTAPVLFLVAGLWVCGSLA